MEVLSNFLSNWTSKLEVPSSRELKFSAPPIPPPSSYKSGTKVPFQQGWKFFLIKLDFHLLWMMQVPSSRELKFSAPPHLPSYQIGLPSSMMEVPSSILLPIKDGSSFPSNWPSMMDCSILPRHYDVLISPNAVTWLQLVPSACKLGHLTVVQNNYRQFSC